MLDKWFYYDLQKVFWFKFTHLKDIKLEDSITVNDILLTVYIFGSWILLIGYFRLGNVR